MYSSLFCGTLKTDSSTSSQGNKENFGLKLYTIELSKYQELVSDAVRILSDSERRRADRYHFEKDKNRFIICRTLLKLLLAQHVGLDINQLHLNIDSNKKPFLSSHPSVFFNLSHSGGYALIAIADSPIGIDIEYVNKDFDYEEILPNIFNKTEIDEVFNSNNKHHTFYRLWTRKEAIVKATGKGIDDDISKIVSLDGYHHVRPELIGNFKTLKVFSFELDHDYIGAIALSGVSKHINNLIFYSIPPTFQDIINNK